MITAQYRPGRVAPSGGFPPGKEPATTTEYGGTRPVVTSPVARSTIFVDAPRNTPMPSTAPSSTRTPSTTSERAPMKQLSSTTTGAACNGSSTPPMPAPPEMWQFLPTWAQEPTVAQVSTIVPLST